MAPKLTFKAQCSANPAGFHKDVLVGDQYICCCCGIPRGTKSETSNKRKSES